MDDLDEGLKKILLAGIGAAAATGEKAQKLFNDLAEKGAATVEQNRDLNERFQKKASEAASAAKDVCQKMTEAQRTRREVAQTLAGMSDAELKQLKEALDSLGLRKSEGENGTSGEQAAETDETAEKSAVESAAAAADTAEEKPAGDSTAES
ncbi:MAG: phasin family protein [Lachnospira sp.]|nr:phasin family protein [Lachnospira sp.]